jgi:hypothetical protein
VRDHRGGHNRTFTPAEESALATALLARSNAPNHNDIRQDTLYERSILDEQQHIHHTRSHHTFTASSSFVTGFKRRNRLSSHRTKLVRAKPKPEAEQRDLDSECFDFVTRVRDAIQRYGDDMVLNMDETPVQMTDAHTTGITRTGSGQSAPIQTDYPKKVSTHTCTHSRSDFACLWDYGCVRTAI